MSRNTCKATPLLALLLLLSSFTLHAQSVWTNDADGVWQDTNNWDNATVPDAVSDVARFDFAAGYTDNRIFVSLANDVTVGGMGFMDSQGGNTDFTIQPQAANSTAIITMNNGTNAPVIQLMETAGADDVRLGNGNRNLELAGTNGLTIVNSGRIILEGSNTYTGITHIFGANNTNGGTGPQIRLRNDAAFGATGTNNHTVVFAAAESGDNGRDIEPTMRTDRDVIIEEDLIYDYTPSSGSRTWGNVLFVESSNNAERHPTFNGDITLRRHDPGTNVVTGDVRWDFQIGSGNTNNLPSNLTLSKITLDDQSATTVGGAIRNQIESNPSGYDDHLYFTGAIDSGTRFGDPVDLSIIHTGDGTTHLQSTNRFEGDVRLVRGTVLLEHPDAAAHINQVRMGDSGATLSGATPDFVKFLIDGTGTYHLRGGGANIQLVDVVSDTNDTEAVASGIGTAFAGGDAMPYVIGSITTNGAVSLMFNQIVYQGDGYNANNNTLELDSMRPQIHLTAEPGGPLTITGRIRDTIVSTTEMIDGQPIPKGHPEVTKIGDGTVILTHPNSEYSGITTVQAGALIIDGNNRANTNLTVEAGATLGGNGRIGVSNALVVVHGHLDPGSRNTNDVSVVGQLNISGQLDLTNATNLWFDLDGPGTGDLVVVTHPTVTTNLVLGGTVVIRDAGNLTTGTYNLFNAGGHIGALPQVDTNLSAAGFTYQIDSPASGDINVIVTSTGPLDTDMDGMPDDYEDANGLNKNDPGDATTDLDLDGSSNLQEYVFGTDPQDIDDVFVLNVPEVAAGVDLRYGPVKSGVTYDLQFTTDLAAGFTTIDTFTAGADAAENVVNDTVKRRGYYRIEASR